MSVYDPFVATALRQIATYGSLIPMARFSQTNDLVNSSVGSITATKQEVQALTLNVSKTDIAKMGTKLLDSLAKGAVKKLLIASSGLSFSPEVNDVFFFNSFYWIHKGGYKVDPGQVSIIEYAFVERTNLSSTQVAAFTA